MNILIAGGAGLIGSALEKKLNIEGHQTVVLDNFTRNSISANDVGGKVITGNGESFSTMNRVFSSFLPEVVFNFVDGSADKDGIYCFQQEADTCITTSTNLCRCIEIYGCVKHLFFGSSGEVYAGGSKRKLKETSKVSFSSYTGATKLYVENMFSMLSEVVGFSFTSLRFFQVYGNRSFINPKYDIVSLYLDVLANEETIAISGKDVCVDLLYVDDAVEAIYLILNSTLSGNEHCIINIGTGVPTKLVDLYHYLGNYFDSPQKPFFIRRGKQIRTLISDITKLKSFDWEQKIFIDDKIKELIKFRMENK